MNAAIVSLRNAKKVSAVRMLRHGGWAQAAVIFLFVILGAGLISGAYAVSYRSFYALFGEPFAGPVVNRYLLEAGFFAMWYFGAASIVMSSPWLLFRNEPSIIDAAPINPA